MVRVVKVIVVICANRYNKIVPADPAQPQTPIDPAADLDQLTKDPVPTLAQEVAEFEASHGGKEREPATVESRRAGELESISEIEVIPETPEIEKLEGYIEQVEKAPETQSPVVDDYTQQVLLSSAAVQNPTVTLPLTEDQIVKGLHHKVMDGLKWLAVWCIRQIKLLHGRVKFKNQ